MLFDVGDICAQHTSDDGGMELDTLHTAGPEHPALGVGQRVDFAANHSLHRFREIYFDALHGN